MSDGRARVLFVAPWIDYGGSDKGTIDWFRWMDRSRFRLFGATTQPSANRRLEEVAPYAEELWALPDLMAGRDMPAFLFDLIATRAIDVVHIMNSRLAYQLLPDLAVLPSPPRVVVQLHVEEPDRSGYVRYVCSRFGNLVHAFSVSSRHLAGIVRGYDVAPSKIHVITTGVDAEEEFNPELVPPEPALADDGVHVLYPHRLVPQKDPLLMVDVAARSVAADPRLRFHALGEGELLPAVREAVRERRLERHVTLHGPTTRLAPWYRAADMLLLTSAFEGIPYVAFEAMAMGVPVVSPVLDGTRELLEPGGGVLVDPRDDTAAYADVLVRLAADAAERERIGTRGRERALAELSVQTMAADHAALYESLLPPAAPAAPPPPPRPALQRFQRRRGERPLVSVIVPCFNDGHFLGECLASIAGQTWPEIELIVVDDASTDAETLALLDRLEDDGSATVVRLSENAGPSHARNVALERIAGRYVLPVDADNVLLPDAVATLVEQLGEAGEGVGFIYPNLQYFGNRRDYFVPPAFNPYLLLHGNFCDTCSLFDADLFRAGVRFEEDIRLGHEDWELALQLLERGVIGQPARAPTVLCRKTGFTRSDSVEFGATAFKGVLEERFPRLYGTSRDWGRWGPHAGAPVRLKAEFAPGLSVVALTPVTARSREADALAAALAAQTCRDVELILRVDGSWRDAAAEPRLRRIPAELAGDAAAALQDGLEVARAPYVLVTEGTAAELLEDPAAVEKLLRALLAHAALDGIVLVDAGGDGGRRLRRLAPDEGLGAHEHAVLLRRDGRARELPERVAVDRDRPVRSLARWFAADRDVEHRHHAKPASMNGPSAGGRSSLRLATRPTATPAERAERDALAPEWPGLPALGWEAVPRWTLSPVSWMPPDTLPLVRHRRRGGDERVFTNDRASPPGFELEWDLGCVHRNQPAGTAELRTGGPEGFTVLPDEDEGAPRLRRPRHPDCLGFLDEAPLPLLDRLMAGWHPRSQQWVLVSGDDPLDKGLEQKWFLGYLEPFPNRPWLAPPVVRRDAAVPLTRSVDLDARRHRYGAGRPAEGIVTLGLGGLYHEPEDDDDVPVWIVDDRVVADGADLPVARRRDVRTRLRWAAAPIAWRGGGPALPRARAALRRGLDAARPPLSGAAPRGAPAGWLAAAPSPERVPVHLALHPVTGDQLLTPWPREAADMGYGPARLLGWASRRGNVVAGVEPRTIDVPWASRFARRVRRA